MLSNKQETVTSLCNYTWLCLRRSWYPHTFSAGRLKVYCRPLSLVPRLSLWLTERQTHLWWKASGVFKWDRLPPVSVILLQPSPPSPGYSQREYKWGFLRIFSEATKPATLVPPHTRQSILMSLKCFKVTAHQALFLSGLFYRHDSNCCRNCPIIETC